VRSGRGRAGSGARSFHEQEEGPLEEPLVRLTSGDAEGGKTACGDPRERADDTIGPYKLLQQIGEGGFGVVYMAEQETPVRRRVALKIIKLGMDTRQVIGRFEAERQALAMMDHPNIAKVLDAGATSTGRPYFVMELVKGEPITEYCDKHNLSVESRLELFQQTCHAVQHAHQKGIIHRDIKPSNVMITLHDGRPVPKVIDFGIAKATNARLTEKTVFTEYRQFIGTPEYMSPEQAEMSGLDIDTRSDVYSLGVLLYELLTGTTPFSPEQLRSAAYGEIQRIIREESPVKPSTRLSTLEALPSVAARRHTDPKRLSLLIRGDLDWIVMKALEKDRTHRYETANGFALDVQRYLDDEPVSAGPPGAVYRLRKLVRRHRFAVGTGMFVAATLLVATGVSLSFAIGEARQRQLASERAEEAARERDIAQATNEFLNEDLLSAVQPSVEAGRGRDVTMREVLDAAASRIAEASRPGGTFADKPLVEASIRSTLGETYRLLGEYDRARYHLERAREIRGRQIGDGHPDTLSSMNRLAVVHMQMSRYDEAARLHEQTLDLRQGTLGAEHPDTLASMNNLANVYTAQGRFDESEPLKRRTLEMRTRTQGEDHPETLISMNNLAVEYMDQGRYAEAQPILEAALKIQKRVLGEGHPNTLRTMDNLANVYGAVGHYEEEKRLHERAVARRKSVLGVEHPDTLRSMQGLADSYRTEGSVSKAERLFIETIEIQKRVLSEDHPHTLWSMQCLAHTYMAQRRYDEAERLYKSTLEAQKRVLGEEHRDTVWTIYNLATNYYYQDRDAEAEPLYAKVLDIRTRTMGQENPFTLRTMHRLAYVYYYLGRLDEAEALHQATLETRRRVLGEHHPDTRSSMSGLVRIYEKQGRSDDVRRLRRARLALEVEAARAEDATAAAINTAAWKLLTHTDEALRDPAVALELAKRACERSAYASPAHIDTLVLAYHLKGETPRAVELLENEMRQALGDDAVPDDLNGVARSLLTHEYGDPRIPAMALEFAARACDLTDRSHPPFLDTLARAQHVTGDTPAAIETQKLALSRMAERASEREQYEVRLTEYEAALRADERGGSVGAGDR
jgi:serine/threonine protein kinase/tetratricopeptide (TPR) repeat protein